MCVVISYIVVCLKSEGIAFVSTALKYCSMILMMRCG
jgi:hypothetical protein